MFKKNTTFLAYDTGVNICVCLVFLFLSLSLPLLAQEDTSIQPATIPRAEMVSPAASVSEIPTVGEVTVAPMATPSNPMEVGVEPGYDGLPLDPSLPIELKILAPNVKEILPTQDVDIFFSLSNYFLAEGGNRLHIIVNNAPPIVKTDIISPLSLKGLSQGGYMIRAMVVKPDGTMIQQPGCMAVLTFYVKKKDFQNYTDPKLPYLTVNLPAQGDIEMDERGRICFDYIIHNLPADGSGAKIRYSLEEYEGFVEQTVGPIFWSDVPQGKHKLVVELFDGKGQPIFGIFNRVERTFDARKTPKAQPYVPPTEGLTDENPH
jgi:hypothetical protein